MTCFDEIERGCRPVVPGPTVRILRLQLLAEVLLGDFGILRLGRVVLHQGVDQILAVVHEVQRQVGRHTVLLAFELHGLQHGFAERLCGVATEIDRLHVRRVAADRIGRDAG